MVSELLGTSGRLLRQCLHQRGWEGEVFPSEQAAVLFCSQMMGCKKGALCWEAAGPGGPLVPLHLTKRTQPDKKGPVLVPLNNPGLGSGAFVAAPCQQATARAVLTPCPAAGGLMSLPSPPQPLLLH